MWWRFLPPIRKVSSEAIAILSARRAGNRGKPTTVTTADAPVTAVDAASQFQEPAMGVLIRDGR
jgi:hypothetical protein